MEASALEYNKGTESKEPALKGSSSGKGAKTPVIKRNPNRGKGTPEELEGLLKAITAQAERVRAKKAEEGEGEKWRKKAVMVEIFKLLDLKHTYCSLSPTPITEEAHPELYVPTEPPHIIKLRWKVRLPNGEIVRLQRPFHDVTYLTGKQILDTVLHQTHKPRKYPNLNGFVKVEVKEADTGNWLNVLPDERYTLPLEFPGPVLKPLWNFDVRVTWPDKATHLGTPAAYDNCKKLPELVDAGVNLFEKPLCTEVDEVLNRAFGVGVSQMVAIATTPENSKFSAEICATRHASVYTTVGVHPGTAAEVPLEDIAKLRELVKTYKGHVVAIGECGIDIKGEKEEHHADEGEEKHDEEEPKEKEGEAKTGEAEKPEEGKDKEKEKETTPAPKVAPLELQLKWLEAQIELGIEVDLPMFFHERGAHQEFVNAVTKYSDKLRGRAVVNCFTGTAEELQHFIELDFYIGITGIICNTARGIPLREVMKKIPLDRLLLGSDAPYLTPFTMPRPYPKINEPAYLTHTLVLAAECLGLSPEELAAITTANTRRLFGLPVLPFDGTLRTKPSLLTYSPNAIMGVCRMPVKKPKKEERKEGEGEKEPALDENLYFMFKGKRYSCTPKEKVILVNQQKALDAAGFEALFKDFALAEIPMPEKKKKKKPFKRGKPRRGFGRGARGGRGRAPRRGGRN